MNSDIEFIAKPNKKRIATSGIAYFCSLMYFVIAGLAVTAIVGVLKKSSVIILTAVGVALLIIIVLRLIDLRYYWFLNEKLVFKTNKIIFTYDEVISSLGHSTVKDEILRLDSYKVTKNKIFLIGEIKHSEPMMKPKIRTKVDLPKNFENYDELIKRLDSYVHNK